MPLGGAPVINDEDRDGRDEGHRYDAPASVGETRSRSWDYAILAVLVVMVVVLVATGVVPLFGV
jgi:hypothetical protein